MGANRPRRRYGAVLAGLLLAAGAPPDPERQLRALAAADARLLQVGERLAIAGAALCPVRAPRLGLALHSLGQYAPAFRPTARTLWSLDATATVLAVAPGGPADSAGLRVGDRLMAIEGVTLPSSADAALVATMLEARTGPFPIDVRRSGRVLRVQVAPVEGCRSRFRLATSRRAGASADGSQVTVTTPLLAFARDNHELAFVLAHEIAHNGWGHKALRARPHDRHLRKALELEADAHALRLMRVAGFDPKRAIPFVQRLYDGPAGGLFASVGHLGRRERLGAIRAQLQSNFHSRLLPARNTPSAESIG